MEELKPEVTEVTESMEKVEDNSSKRVTFDNEVKPEELEKGSKSEESAESINSETDEKEGGFNFLILLIPLLIVCLPLLFMALSDMSY